MEINIPKSWDEISVATFMELLEIEATEHKSGYNKNIDIISTVADVEDVFFDDYYIDEIIDLFDSIKFIKTQPSLDYVKTIGEYNFKPLSNISFGEFLDVQFFMQEDMYKNLPIIAAILYRKVDNDRWGHKEWEPYDGLDIYERGKDFNNIPINTIFGIIDAFIKWREEMMNTYVSIFKPSIEDEDPDEELSAEDLEDEKKEKEIERFSWHFVIDNLTNGDLTKTNEVTNLPFIQVMNYLTMKKIKPN